MSNHNHLYPSNDLTSVTLVSTAARPLLQAWLAEMERAAGSTGTGPSGARGQAREDRRRRRQCLTMITIESTVLGEGARKISIVLSVPNIVKHRLHARRRRKRTVIETDHRHVLEAAFRREPRPGSGELRRLGSCLGLDTAVVRVWFCNRCDCRRGGSVLSHATDGRRQKEKQKTPGDPQDLE